MSKKQKNKQKKKLVFELKHLYVLFLSIILILSVFNLTVYFDKKTHVVHGSESTNNENKVLFWEQLVSVHPDYFEGWIELANIYRDKGNYRAAFNAYLNAKKINPNSEKVNSLQKYFEMK